MWLINVATVKLEEFVGDSIPSYAILSHTWGDEEVTFQELRDLMGFSRLKFEKLRRTCQLAEKRALGYIWVDTCCIDKSSSAELSEAINSMYEWYQNATVCYVYLVDMGHETSLSDCRWFTRGWCLQELLAPKVVEFYDAKWEYYGDKLSLLREINAVTGIDISALDGSLSLDYFTVQQRMSWAADRKTTRREDIAYSLLGVFGVNMPLIYGEGDRAFLRLQEQIIGASNDPSIFAWCVPNPEQGVSGILAKSPQDFKPRHLRSERNSFQNFSDTSRPEYSTTNGGIVFHQAKIWVDRQAKLNILELDKFMGLLTGIYIRKISAQQHIRARPDVIAKTLIEHLRPSDYDEMRVTIPRHLTPQSLSTLITSETHTISVSLGQPLNLVGRPHCILGEEFWDSGRNLFMVTDNTEFLGILSLETRLMIGSDIFSEKYILICYVGNLWTDLGFVRAFIIPDDEWRKFTHLIEHGRATHSYRWNLWEKAGFFSAFHTTSRDLTGDSSNRAFSCCDIVSCTVTTKGSFNPYAAPLLKRGYARQDMIEIFKRRPDKPLN